MKMSDLLKVQALGAKLEAIDGLSKWLDNFPGDGLRLGNGVMVAILLPRDKSIELLAAEHAMTTAELQALGVEEG